jgi:hypothetical protein
MMDFKLIVCEPERVEFVQSWLHGLKIPHLVNHQRNDIGEFGDTIESLIRVSDEHSVVVIVTTSTKIVWQLMEKAHDVFVDMPMKGLRKTK